MAVLVLKAIRNDSVMIADLTNDQITQRLIGCSEDSDAYAVLALLGLFDHVGYRESVASEWEPLRTTILPHVSRDAFHRYWRVTPPPLAVRLTRRWLEDALPETLEQLFSPGFTRWLWRKAS